MARGREGFALTFPGVDLLVPGKVYHMYSQLHDVLSTETLLLLDPDEAIRASLFSSISITSPYVYDLRGIHRDHSNDVPDWSIKFQEVGGLYKTSHCQLKICLCNSLI
jgi:hypothetical protein